MIAISDFSAKKTPTRQRSNFPPRGGLTSQIPHSPGTESGRMAEVTGGGGMLKFRFDRRIISKRTTPKETAEIMRRKKQNY